MQKGRIRVHPQNGMGAEGDPFHPRNLKIHRQERDQHSGAIKRKPDNAGPADRLGITEFTYLLCKRSPSIDSWPREKNMAGSSRSIRYHSGILL